MDSNEINSNETERIDYKIHARTICIISRQLLRAIEYNNMQLAQMTYNHLKGKLAKMRKEFSSEYLPLIGDLELSLIGPNSIIVQEAAKRGGLT